MAFRPWIDLIREQEEDRRAADTVTVEGAAYRAWGRMGIGMAEIFPVGRTYERMRIDDPDIRPSTFLKALPDWQERQDARADRQRERLEAAIPIPTPIKTPELPPLPEPPQFPLADIAQGFQPTDALGFQQVAFGSTPGTFQQNLQQEGARRAVEFGQQVQAPGAAQRVSALADTLRRRGVTPQAFQEDVGVFGPTRVGNTDPLNFALRMQEAGRLPDEDLRRVGAGDVSGAIGGLMAAAQATQNVTGQIDPGFASAFGQHRVQTQARQELAGVGDPFSLASGLLAEGAVSGLGAAGFDDPRLQAGIRIGAPLVAAVVSGGAGVTRLPSSVRPLAAAFEAGPIGRVARVAEEVAPAARSADEIIDAATALREGVEPNLARAGLREAEPDLARVGLPEAETPLGRSIESIEPLEIAPAQPGRTRPVETVGIRGEPKPGTLRTAQEIATEGMPPAQIASEGAGAGRLADEGAEVVASRARVAEAEAAGTLDSAAKLDLAETMAADRAGRLNPRKIADSIQEAAERAGRICERS